ncbi:zinc-finger homeodomain protein 9-like [Cornus florida]|uniref:zinc-finger homeodomain protein 9-like n=1 Tax=Cornus florida TaxID=4283 RepID=UPI002897CED5|nr:zinc-finger homeodomain protein 9-like [Cornus florida]
MDLTTTPTKNPDAENETPPQTKPNSKSLSFTNYALKQHHHHHHHHLTAVSPPPAAVVTYGECQKNHAASLGGYAVDGCGEYLPSPTTTPTDRTSLNCAACGCHRNFHRREPDYTTTTTHFLDFRRHPPLPPPQPPRRINSPSTSPSTSLSPPPPPGPPPPPPPPSSYYPSTPHMLLALSTAVQHQPTTNHRPVVAKAENPSGRKRFRTKFSQEQKEKMLSFSERLGWKMQKCDEGLVEEFCNEVGVGKGVLKVWMHNNKHNFGKRETNTTTTTVAATTTTNNNNSCDRIISYDEHNNGHNINIDNTNKINNSTDYHGDDDSSGAHLHDSTDGSSSS